MPAERSGIPGHRHDRVRTHSPWVTDPGPISASGGRASIVYNDNYNQNMVAGPASIVNSNPTFNLPYSSDVFVHYNLVTNFAPASGPILNTSVRVLHDIQMGSTN